MATLERMNPLDAWFLYAEEDGVNHMNILSFIILEGPPPAYEDLLALVESKLPQLPRYRQVIRPLPLQIARPVWVDDANFVDADTPGFEVVREIPTLDHAMIGGHCEVTFEDCRVGDDAVLGEVDAGFRYAQVRLAPARLTHCMRWLGIARRSLDIALERTRERELFGTPLQELGLAQQLIADSVIDIEASRGLIRHAVGVIDAGGRGSQESSVAKTFVSEAVDRVVDRAIQLCGGAGVTHETPLGRFMNEVRAFRIYDGPAETHRWAIARREVRRAATVI